MDLFNVYKLWPIEPVQGRGCVVTDKDGVEYLDFYGGHAVISVGHSHPEYVRTIQSQAAALGFYSNSVENPLQAEVAEGLGRLSGYSDYSLFLSNSGAEANENALKLASFHTGRKKVLAFRRAFHGRTSGAVSVTDNPKIVSPFNSGHEVVFTALGDIAAVEKELSAGDFAAVIIEGIQGVAGIYEPSAHFWRQLREVTAKYGTVLIADEIQSGYGRTGEFFAHQHSGVKPDIITTAKGMGNGFPVGGTLISSAFEPVAGMLGTTFGGNHLACAATSAVLKIIEKENLVAGAAEKGKYLMDKLQGIALEYGPAVIYDVRGRGLMLGVEMAAGYEGVRNGLLYEDHIFTGGAGANVIRLLPPLTVSYEQINRFLDRFARQIEKRRSEL